MKGSQQLGNNESSISKILSICLSRMNFVSMGVIVAVFLTSYNETVTIAANMYALTIQMMILTQSLLSGST